jgi:hypothetical protein
MFKNSEDVMTRSILRGAWNNQFVNKTLNNKGRVTTPFRAVNNLGDFLGRQNYVCGGSTLSHRTFPGRMSFDRHVNNVCDGTGITGSSCNPKFVADSSDYVRYLRQSATVKNYNDLKNGGDQNHASYVAWMAIRRR